MSDIDYSLKWCTYISEHPNKFFYIGKGITKNVRNGTYKGSGTRFKLALQHPGFEFHTWSTTILSTFHYEDEAYEAEAKLVPIELLADPYCMNGTAGGRKGAYATPSRLLKSRNTKERQEKRAITMTKKKEEMQRLKDKLKAQEQIIKDLK